MAVSPVHITAPGTVAIVTGFYIPASNPPAPENDGIPGTLALARGLLRLGYKVILITDSFCIQTLSASLKLFTNFSENIEVIEFPFNNDDDFVVNFFHKYPSLKFLISIERVGPTHTLNSVLKQGMNVDINDFHKYGPGSMANQCLNMKGELITSYSAKIYKLFEYINLNKLNIITIGIGDGGNEIGIGKILWSIIQENIIGGNGGKIACRISTDYTIVAGVSNWGAYGLIAAIYTLINKPLDELTVESETNLIRYYIDKKNAVDGVLGYPNMSVDGIEWKIHLSIINFLHYMLNNLINGNTISDRNI